MQAYKLGFREPSLFADLGRVAALRTFEAKDLSSEQRTAFIAESESYYKDAFKSGEKLGYIYDSWATSKYWAGDYSGAGEKIKIARAHGAGAKDPLLSMLAKKMPEPK